VPWLLGDWDGARTRLLNISIDFQFGYTSEVAGNATGDQRRQAAYTDQFWYDQKFIDGAVDRKIGRITFGEDFAFGLKTVANF